MNTPRRILSALVFAPLAAAALAGCTGMHGQGAEMKMMPASVKDGILVSSTGMSLYTFDKDPSDGSLHVDLLA